MRSIFRTIFFYLIIASLAVPTAFASFEDVFEGHDNYQAINYLQETGVIQGYEDGTFKPALKVNRVEFLKILLEGSNIELDATIDLTFNDVDTGAWYAPYIKKAYAEGWVIGYSDGTFKPTQTINKVEALKIVGEVQGWNTADLSSTPFEDTPADAWYTPYVSYAKEAGYLEEVGSHFTPSGVMTRAAISEVIYRTSTVETSETNEEETEETEDEEEEEQEEENEDLSFTPIAFETISKTYFSKISLDEGLPNTFYENEVYIISGEISSGSYDEVTVLIDEDTTDDDYDTYSTDTNGDNFEIAVHFPESGNYHIGILPGDNGQTKVEEISVLPTLPSSKNSEDAPSKASMLDIDHDNDQTYIEFSSPSSTIKKLIVEQGSREVMYISRQDIDEIFIHFPDFKNFKEKETSYYIKSAKLSSTAPLEISSSFVTSETETFDALIHTYSEIEANNIDTSPASLLSSSQKISFSGTLNIDTKSSAYVIKPDGFVEEIDLSTSSPMGSYYSNETILDGGSFNFFYDPTSNGRHIVEIVDKNGLPIVNHPIYIGGGIPLIPDYFDLNKRSFYKGSVNLSSAREELLELINESREDHGLSTVDTDNSLNDLAQAHSNDMVENDYFSHFNLEGETPSDRRIEAGITTNVSENIAQDTSIEFAHEGLMRSATHRSNILNDDWEKVGIGISKNDGYLIVTEEFSTSEIVAADLDDYKNELEDEINELRAENGVSEISVDSSVENAAEELNDRVINEGATLDNGVFQDVLSVYSIAGSSQAVGRTYSTWGSILSSILEENVVISSSWEKMGISVELDDSGTIHTILILNDQS
ncbi:hypothetical protein HON58_02270 [Candidatus Peregrinibacteria bacterium]|nr:hypothetical protein [Candidatus Peregrinibacteria bacterium]